MTRGNYSYPFVIRKIWTPVETKRGKGRPPTRWRDEIIRPTLARHFGIEPLRTDQSGKGWWKPMPGPLGTLDSTVACLRRRLWSTVLNK